MSLLQNAELTLKIKTAVIMDERIGAGDINVDTNGSVVTLRGTIPNGALREVAEGIALRHGARQVVNELVLENPAGEEAGASVPEEFPRVTTSAGAPVVEGPSLLEAVEAALAADRRVNEHLLYVKVEDGVAYLTGRQDTVSARDAATEVATHVPGIVGVNNDLEVLASV